MKKHYFIPLAFLGLFACGSPEKKEPVLSPDNLFEKAEATYKNGDYRAAQETINLLEAEYPFSKHTKEGLLLLAHSHFELEEYTDAISTLNRYMDIYPSANDSDYALYILALSYYNQIGSAERDQKFSLEARKYLNQLMGRYPDSQYIADARLKRDFVEDHLAAKEMIIGRFYLKQDQLTAAINRFKVIVKNYDTTRHVKEALYRLVESYLILGLKQPAYEAANLLGYNHPESHWYHDAYKLMQDYGLETKAKQRPAL